MITDELLRANGMTRGEYERDLQRFREWAKAYKAALKDSRSFVKGMKNSIHCLRKLVIK